MLTTHIRTLYSGFCGVAGRRWEGRVLTLGRDEADVEDVHGLRLIIDLVQDPEIAGAEPEQARAAPGDRARSAGDRRRAPR